MKISYPRAASSRLILGLILTVIGACKSEKSFRQDKQSAVPATSSDLTGSAPQSNDRPSESNPGVPGYYLFCREPTVAKLPNEKQYLCGLADAANTPSKPPFAEWTLERGTFSEKVAVSETILSDAGPYLVMFSLLATSDIDLSTVASELTVKLAWRGSEADAIAQRIAAPMKDALAASIQDLTISPGETGTRAESSVIQ